MEQVRRRPLPRSHALAACHARAHNGGSGPTLPGWLQHSVAWRDDRALLECPPPTARRSVRAGSHALPNRDADQGARLPGVERQGGAAAPIKRPRARHRTCPALSRARLPSPRRCSARPPRDPQRTLGDAGLSAEPRRRARRLLVQAARQACEACEACARGAVGPRDGGRDGLAGGGAGREGGRGLRAGGCCRAASPRPARGTARPKVARRAARLGAAPRAGQDAV